MEEAEKTEKLTVMAGKTLEHSGAHGGDGEGGGGGEKCKDKGDREKKEKERRTRGNYSARAEKGIDGEKGEEKKVEGQIRKRSTAK